MFPDLFRIFPPEMLNRTRGTSKKSQEGWNGIFWNKPRTEGRDNVPLVQCQGCRQVHLSQRAYNLQFLNGCRLKVRVRRLYSLSTTVRESFLYDICIVIGAEYLSFVSIVLPCLSFPLSPRQTLCLAAGLCCCWLAGNLHFVADTYTNFS